MTEIEQGQGSAGAAGTTVIRRDVFDGRVWSAYPTRVLEETTRRMTLVQWPGVTVMVPVTWIRWLEGGPEALRLETLPQLAAKRWELGPWVWRSTQWVHHMEAGRWFSIASVTDDATGHLSCWYINFERPFVRHRGSLDRPAMVDTMDLFLDLVVDPDGGLRWKDESEYAHARRLGLITDSEATAVSQAREEALFLVASGALPTAYAGPAWRRVPTWPAPHLADGWDKA